MERRQIKNKKFAARSRVAAEVARRESAVTATRRSAAESKQRAATKMLICLRIDRDVLGWFKERGRGYQTRINTVLRAFRDASI